MNHRLIFSYKVSNGDKAWSSAIVDLYEMCKAQINNIEEFKINTSGIKSVFDSWRRFSAMELKKDDIVIFNHAISFWGMLPLFLASKKKGVKFYFLVHEHEHILGISYFFKFFSKIKFRQQVIYSKWWYKFPARFSHKTYCLSSQQGDYIKMSSYIRLSYLGIKPNFFPPKINKNNNDQINVLFPHDIKRFDKGYRFCSFIIDNNIFNFIFGRKNVYAYNEVYLKYHNADIVFLPSDSESYSLVFAEALCTNSIIVTNRNVGIVQLLTGKYTANELKAFGLFISEHDQMSYQNTLLEAVDFYKSDVLVKTSELFKEFDFSLSHTSNEFIKTILSNT